MIALLLIACGDKDDGVVDAWLAANAPEMTRTSEVSVTAEFRCWRYADSDGSGVSIATLDGEQIAKIVHFSGDVGASEFNPEIRAYQAAWVDLANTGSHLQEGWAPGGRFVDPSADVKGRERLEDHIERVAGNPLFGKMEFEQVGGMDVQGDTFRFHWQMVGPGGKVWISGYDYGEVDEHGRVDLLVGCWE